MHEMGLARQVVAASIQAAGNQNLQRLASVAIEVSPLAVVDVEELQECFEIAARGTPAEGASLQVKRLPLAAVCEKCGERVVLDVGGQRTSPVEVRPPAGEGRALDACPKCGGSLEIPPMPDWRVVSVQPL
jgi:hydrogenase nickel incorporation protein HypA/HybF